jgi:hypothetical protein
MKNLLIILLIFFCTHAKADQLAWISKEQAEKTIEFFEMNEIYEVVLWCGCCDHDHVQKISITNIFFRYTGTDQFYEVVIEGIDEMGEEFSNAVDLAYVHIQAESFAHCLGIALEFECDPCTPPFDWPE